MVLAVLAALIVSASGSVVRKAPEFVIQMPDGKQTLLSSYRGKNVVLVFMFTTCTHCQKAAPILARLQDELGSKGVQFLGATFDQDAKKNVADFVRIFGINFPCGYSTDENIHAFLGLPKDTPPFVPIVTIIDRTGTIRAQHMVTGDKKDPKKDEAENAYLADIEKGIRGDLEGLLKAGPASAKK